MAKDLRLIMDIGKYIFTGGKSGELGSLVPGKFSSLAGNRDVWVNIERDMMIILTHLYFSNNIKITLE